MKTVGKKTKTDKEPIVLVNGSTYPPSEQEEPPLVKEGQGHSGDDLRHSASLITGLMLCAGVFGAFMFLYTWLKPIIQSLVEGWFK